MENKLNNGEERSLELFDEKSKALFQAKKYKGLSLPEVRFFHKFLNGSYTNEDLENLEMDLINENIRFHFFLRRIIGTIFKNEKNYNKNYLSGGVLMSVDDGDVDDGLLLYFVASFTTSGLAVFVCVTLGIWKFSIIMPIIFAYVYRQYAKSTIIRQDIRNLIMGLGQDYFTERTKISQLSRSLEEKSFTIPYPRNLDKYTEIEERHESLLRSDEDIQNKISGVREAIDRLEVFIKLGKDINGAFLEERDKSLEVMNELLAEYKNNQDSAEILYQDIIHNRFEYLGEDDPLISLKNKRVDANNPSIAQMETRKITAERGVAMLEHKKQPLIPNNNE
ncbi:hypothetical protein COB57_01110 [Candidatus Peregrinibacteria bacterium]|nr:MAG: hypothetical protein COB57_01110 [Candidatus Peregrinibacteria bacterium]